MPIRTERVTPKTLHDLKKSKTNCLKEQKVNNKLLKELRSDYFGISSTNILEHDNAKNITNNVKINRFNEFVFNVLDRFNPFLQKHPKIADKFVKICEKFFVFEKKFSKGIQ